MFKKSFNGVVDKSLKFLFRGLQEKPHILHKSRNGKMKYLTDFEILSESEYPAEFGKSSITVGVSEMKSDKGRRALGWLYKNFKELCKKKKIINNIKI
jgi:hypothetical protein